MGTHVHPWQIHVSVWQIQYSIVKQNKVKIKIKKKIKVMLGSGQNGQHISHFYILSWTKQEDNEPRKWHKKNGKHLGDRKGLGNSQVENIVTYG